MAGKATVGLLLHWPCVSDFSCFSNCGFKAYGREMSYTPHRLWYTSPLLLHSPDLIPGKPPIELSFFIWYLHPVSNIWLCVLTPVCPPNGMSIGLTSIAQLVSLFLCSAHSALRCVLHYIICMQALQHKNLIHQFSPLALLN